MTRIALGDIHLNVEEAGSGAPIVLLHGFTGSAASWAPHAEALAGAYRVLAVDLIGHGASDSPADAARYGMQRCIDDLAALLDRLAVERAHCLGYSMGGRIALAFAVAHPGRVRSLVLEGASPGIAGAAERRQRVESDRALAARIEREGVSSFVDFWMGQSIFASQARCAPEVLAAARRRRLANSATGLANSLRGMGTGAQPPLWDRLPALDLPVLLVVGAVDEKFREIARVMQRALPRPELAVIPEAGHTTHLENPAEFRRRVCDFLQRNSSSP